MEGGAVGHNFERDPPKDHPCQVWFNSVQGFRREDLNVKVYDVRRTTSDGKSSPGLWPGELKKKRQKMNVVTIIILCYTGTILQCYLSKWNPV
jgi:hypothetical protein